MRITLDEQRELLRVESEGRMVLDVERFPVAALKAQLRAWLRSATETSGSVFIFSSEHRRIDGVFRIEPRPDRWQFTSWKERFRSTELLSLKEWNDMLRQSGV